MSYGIAYAATDIGAVPVCVGRSRPEPVISSFRDEGGDGLPRLARAHGQPFLEVMMQSLRLRLRHHPTLLVCDDIGQQWTCGTGESVLPPSDRWNPCRIMITALESPARTLTETPHAMATSTSVLKCS